MRGKIRSSYVVSAATNEFGLFPFCWKRETRLERSRSHLEVDSLSKHGSGTAGLRCLAKGNHDHPYYDLFIFQIIIRISFPLSASTTGCSRISGFHQRDSVN